MRGQKKHDMKYLFCLRSNDGDGKMEFQGLSDSCEAVQSTETKRRGSINGGSSVESGLEPGISRPRSRDLTTRPPRPKGIEYAFRSSTSSLRATTHFLVDLQFCCKEHTPNFICPARFAF
ncbi:hypothetical protein AVEN_168993-1 [Araneus ventricosus]|uniref:Uncharacterized protein n=1 Tax=Araneus ventricosus TaxID=182803 RepID=A0A4Y2KER1_ARAVE|nr:hypothetical protein AVEN_168993-1 [Araneus ventricosus]